MVNKLAFVGIAEPVSVLTGNPRFDWVWVWRISDFFN